MSTPKNSLTGFSLDGAACDRLGNANLPKSKWQLRLARLRIRWGNSLVTTILAELGSLPLRILAILREPELRLGYHLPLSLEGQSTKILYPPNKFLLACNRDILQLNAEHPWAGVLDLTLAARAFQRGAQWGVSTNSGRHSTTDLQGS